MAKKGYLDILLPILSDSYEKWCKKATDKCNYQAELGVLVIFKYFLLDFLVKK
jgi:hypothetical protein